MTALAMSITYAGAPIDPRTFNTALTLAGPGHGYDTNSNLQWPAATLTAASLTKTQLTWWPVSDSGDLSAVQNELEHVVVDLGFPVIVGVNIGFYGTVNNGVYAPGHYVLVTGKVGDTFTIVDPGSSNTFSLDAYGNHNPYNPSIPGFELRGYVTDPPASTRLVVSATAATPGVQLAVSDGEGRLTGYDAATGQRAQQISNSVGFIDSLENDVTGEAPTTISQLVDIVSPQDGQYVITVHGVTDEPTPFTLLISGWADDGSNEAPLALSGVAQGTAPIVFKVGINPTSTGQPMLITPLLDPIHDLTVDEGSSVGFTAIAHDADPAATLLYGLDPGAPAGAAIDPLTGAFTWTTTDAQVPGVYSVTIRVTDAESAILTDAKTFTIRVRATQQLPQNLTDADVLRTVAQAVLELQALLNTGIRAGDEFVHTHGKEALWQIDNPNNPTYQIPVLLQMLSAQNQAEAAALYHDAAQWMYWGWQALFTTSLDMEWGRAIDAATASTLITSMQQYAQRIKQNPLATTFLGGELISAEAQVLGVEFATEDVVALLQEMAGGMFFQPFSLQPVLPV